jgi:hypothetical protein
MKLRGKKGLADFRVVYPDGKEITIDPSTELLPYQHFHMSYQPDMILTYAHRIRDRIKREENEDVAIYVNASCALNGRDTQRFIDPKTNLAKEDFSWAAYPWILPLETELPTKE